MTIDKLKSHVLDTSLSKTGTEVHPSEYETDITPKASPVVDGPEPNLSYK